MELFIPDIGTKIILEQDWQITLYNEYRNHSLFSSFGITSRCDTVVELPKGLILKVDRIYIRKGASAFSSISFSCPKMKTKAEKLDFPSNLIYGGSKFWVKLHECNGIIINLPESNLETVSSLRLLYLEMEKECVGNKDSLFRNPTNLLKLFNQYLGPGINLNNLQTNLTFDVFLQKMLLRMDKIKDKNIEYFRSKFKTHLRDQKLNDLLNGK